MNSLKQFLRRITPYGLIEAHRRRFRLHRLGLISRGLPDRVLEKAVVDCHYELWPEFLRTETGWTLLDAGANEGDFVRAATLLGRPGAVLAFEPQPVCKPVLESVLTTVPNARLIAAAVGSAPGQVSFYCTGNSKMASVLAPRRGIEKSYASGDYAIIEKVMVPVMRLDDAVPVGTNIGLLKLDVQGYEIEALRGATRVLTETKALLVEINYVPHYEGAVDFDTLHRVLGEAGFRLHGVSAPFVDQSKPLWADAMYVRRPI
jgi:FkbM family methyltransferase